MTMWFRTVLSECKTGWLFKWPGICAGRSHDLLDPVDRPCNDWNAMKKDDMHNRPGRIDAHFFPVYRALGTFLALGPGGNDRHEADRFGPEPQCRDREYPGDNFGRQSVSQRCERGRQFFPLLWWLAATMPIMRSLRSVATSC